MTARALAAILALGLAWPAAAQEERVTAAATLFLEGQYDEARHLLAGPAAAGTSAAAAYYMGRVAFAQERYGEAARWLEAAAALDPGEPAIPLWLGNAYARAAFEAPLWRKPALGFKARDAWQSSLDIDPLNPTALRYLASWYLAVPPLLGGSVERARRYAVALQRIDPYSGGLALARIHAHHLDDAAAAEKGYRALLAAYPDSTAPALRLANLLAAAGRADEGVAVLEEALARHPAEPLRRRLDELAATP